MTLRFKQLYSLAFAALILSLSSAAPAQKRAYQGSDRRVQILLNRLETGTDAFGRNIERAYSKIALINTSKTASIRMRFIKHRRLVIWI